MRMVVVIFEVDASNDADARDSVDAFLARPQGKTMRDRGIIDAWTTDVKGAKR